MGFSSQILQDSPKEDPSSNRDGRSGLRGIPWKDFSKSGFVVRNVDTHMDGIPQSVNAKKLDAHHSARKSKRIRKSHVFDDADDDDDEIQYLEKLRTSRLASNYVADYEDEDEDVVVGKKQKNISRISNADVYDYNGDMGYNYSRTNKENMLSRSGRAFEDTDYFEEETSSDDQPEPKKKRLSKMGDLESEMAVTTRRGALRRGKAISAIDFPNGLPPAPPKSEYLFIFPFFPSS